MKKKKILTVIALGLLLASCSHSRKEGVTSISSGTTGDSTSLSHPAMSGKTGAAPAGTHHLDIPHPPVMMTGTSERLDYLATHYWDNLDYHDTTWIADTTALESNFYAWVELLRQLPPYRAAKLTGGLIQQAIDRKAPNSMLLRLASVAEHYFRHPNSPFRNEEFYIPVLRAVISAPSLEEAYKIRPRLQLEHAQKNRPSMIASNFVYTTASGEMHSLHQSGRKGNGKSCDYTLLFFYNPDCEECRRVKQIISTSPQLSPLINSGRLHVLAIYADEDINLWRTHLPEMPTNWTVGYDKEQVIIRSALYDLTAIPCLYLMDKDMRVVLKDAQVEDVVSFQSFNKL